MVTHVPQGTLGSAASPAVVRGGLSKAPTGVIGLDEVTGGGLPRGRPTLVCGPAGCGKTLLGMQFLVRGVTDYGEPGVFLSFEESVDELVQNVASLGFDVQRLQDDGLLVMDNIALVHGDVEEAGSWDLEGLFIRLGAAIDEVGATRVVLDTIDTLFGVFTDAALLRSELRRLFGWLKRRGVTAVITGERGEGALTRHGIEEYVSDCVIVLDHRVDDQISTRRLRILKYRGSLHGTNEYPFLIGSRGVTVMPITSLGLQHAVSSQRMSSGEPGLDAMLGGGVFRGSSVLLSGTAGTGKSTLAAQFSAAACDRGERALFCAFEESAAQIVRNMLAVGIDLTPWVASGLLEFVCIRPSLFGLESHLATIQERVTDHEPDVVVIDPISDLLHAGGGAEVTAMLTRQVDYLKTRGVTAVFTSLDAGATAEAAERYVGSLIDTWIVTQLAERGGVRRREIYVLKSRGSAHSQQTRGLEMSDRGMRIAELQHAAAGTA